MMATAKYVIFLPVCNGARYVCEAIDSIIAQTVSNWMLVVLDNASTDNTVELVGKYQHPNIQLLASPNRLSIWESWRRIWCILNDGAPGGEYMTVIGHDDRLLPAFLETIDGLIAAYPSASLYQTAFSLIDDSGNQIRPCRPIPGQELSTEFIAARLWGLRDSFGIGYVFRAADYLTVGGIPNLPQLLHADDILFARLSHIHFKAASSSIQCEYRLHRGSTSRSLTADRITAQVAAIDSYVNVLQQEFGDFMTSGGGAAALACFLAREVMLMRMLALRWLLPDVTCQSIRRLESIYRSVAGDTDYRRWLGTNFVARDMYVRAKQLMLLSILVMDKLSHRKKQ